MKFRHTIFVSVSASTLFVTNSFAASNNEPVKLGVIVDMSGVYLGIGGLGGVAAVKMAVRDFGGKVLGRPIEVLSADYQNKVDVTAMRAREWYDQDNVAVVIESTESASALALQWLGVEKRKVTIFSGSATTDLTVKQCSPYGVHYVYNTYFLANGTARAVVAEGGKSWYFITADYAFGHSLQAQAEQVVNSMGGGWSEACDIHCPHRISRLS